MKPSGVSRALALLFGQWFFSGRFPVAPGTAGTLAALPLYYLLRLSSHEVLIGATILITLVGFWASEVCAQILGDKDPSSVVIDEVAGMLLALSFLPGAGPALVLVAFILFRLFDIKKPWLIDRVQYLRPPGVGIMADDILAGLVAGVLSWAVAQWVGPILPLLALP